MSWQNRLRYATPGIVAVRVAEALARLVRLNSSMWSGDYGDWARAQAACRDHGLGPMCESYARAYEAMAGKEGAFERDGRVMGAGRLDWPLLTACGALQAAGARRLTVLDFGGGFGSVYFQHRAWLAAFPEVRWAVVEQGEVVRRAREVVKDPQVRFFEGMEEAVACWGGPDIVCASGVISQLPDPEGFLAEVAALRAAWVFADRITQLEGEGRHWVARQKVPSVPYLAEGPFWFFDRDLFRVMLERYFRVAGEFESQVDEPGWLRGRRFRFSGFLLQPRPS